VAPLGVGDENHDQDLAFTAFRKSFWANLQKAEEDLRRATEKGVSGPIGDEDDDDDDDDANGATGEPLVCPAATEQCVFYGLLTHSLLLAQHQLDIEDLGAVAKGINKAKRAKSKKVTKQSSDPSSESSDASEVAINPRPPRASREEGTEASAGGCGSDDEAANGDDDDDDDDDEEETAVDPSKPVCVGVTRTRGTCLTNERMALGSWV